MKLAIPLRTHHHACIPSPSTVDFFPPFHHSRDCAGCLHLLAPRRSYFQIHSSHRPHTPRLLPGLRLRHLLPQPLHRLLSLFPDRLHLPRCGQIGSDQRFRSPRQCPHAQRPRVPARAVSAGRNHLGRRSTSRWTERVDAAGRVPINPCTDGDERDRERGQCVVAGRQQLRECAHQLQQLLLHAGIQRTPKQYRRLLQESGAGGKRDIRSRPIELQKRLHEYIPSPYLHPIPSAFAQKRRSS